MNISKRKQGILAIICTIAMIVTSITVYNPREVKADTDYSKLTYNYKNQGEAFMKGSETTKSPWRVAIDESQSKGDIVNWMTTGAGSLNFYNEMFMSVTWHGNYPDATLEINGVKVEKVENGGNGVQVFNSAEIHVNAKEWINNNAYNVVKVTSKDGSQYVTFIVATGDKAVTSSEETTTGSSTEPFDPSTIKDSEWTLAKDSKTVSYYIADGKADKVSVTPQLRGDNCYYMAFKLAAKFKSVTFDGVSKDVPGGADYEVKVSDLTSGYHTLVVTDFYGEESVTIYFKVAKEEETTTAAYKDGEVLVNESNKTIEVPSYSGGDPWQKEYNNTSVKYVAGKKYVAEVVVSSTAAKKIKMVFQRSGTWDFVDSNSGYEVSIAAGNKVKITYVFEATKSTDDGIFDIHLGSVADATTLVFESKKLTTYNEVPDGVQTGVEVLEAPGTTKYTVSIDGTEKQYEEGATITVPADGQGYYDVTKKVAYAPKEVITVDRNITVTSIRLNVAMESGAGIKLTTPTGLRFKTNVTGTTDILSQSDIIKTGTIITASDILDGGTVDDNFVKSNKLKLNIENENNGWYGKTVGTFCASIVELQEENYARDFVGVGYVTITYNDGTEKTIYAPSGTVRAVATVAQNIQNSKDIYKNDMTYYNYLKSLNKDYGTIIDTYAAATKNNQ